VLTRADAIEILRSVVDPELHINIVDLGLVYEVEIKDGGAVWIDMTLTSPGCPYGPMILHQIRFMLEDDERVNEVRVNVVWDPPWGPDQMSDEARLELGYDV